MIVTAWNNGKHHDSGAGYGLKLTISDRDKYFIRDWKQILLYFSDSGEGVEVNIDKDSFWDDTCRELISIDIGKWFLQNNYAPWPKGLPPKIELEPIIGNKFRLVSI